MTLRGDVLKALDKWLLDEFGNGLEDEGTADIGFCYSQYRGETTAEEQWWMNVDTMTVWLEVYGDDADDIPFAWPEAKVYEFSDYDEMLEFSENMTFDGLIGEADGFIEENELGR